MWIKDYTLMNTLRAYLPNPTTMALIAAVALVAAVGSIDPAFAQAPGGGAFQPIESAFDKVLDFLTGTFATTAATIAVSVCGYLALTSRIPWMMCFSIVVGVAFIFGGAQIVQTLSGGGL
jgi:type IV secretion system protein VirB2